MSRIPQGQKYTNKIDIPHYHPTDEQPEIGELINERKAQELLRGIENARVGSAEKDFLIKAAYRHHAFNYRKIAQYYASAGKEMQKMMEQSALVIIDYDDAIKNGYARLSRRMEELRKADAE